MSDARKSLSPVSFTRTSGFKIWVVTFIFFLVFFHLFNLVALPKTSILSDKIILGVVLALVAYLWIQEVRDRQRLEIINNELIANQRRLQEAQVDTISALILMEEAKYPALHGHSQRVLLICRALAEAMGLTGERKGVVRRASVLHDLGMLVLPEEIGHKKYSDLSDEEQHRFRDHPRMAVTILEPLKFLTREKKIILHHHERVDGTGYPSGLKGEMIPLESRMIAVADMFETLNAERPGQDIGKVFIFEELRRHSGTSLDAKLVIQLLDVLEKNPELWDKEKNRFKGLCS